MRVISVKVSDEIAAWCEGYEVALRVPLVGEKVIDSYGNPTVQVGDFMTTKRLVLTPKFDLAKWWPEWLLADELSHDGVDWVAEKHPVEGRDSGHVSKIMLHMLNLDTSQLDKNQVYRNPNKEVGK